MFQRRSVDFRTISVPFTRTHHKVICVAMWRRGVERDCDVIADVDNGWGECIVAIGYEVYAWNVHFDSRLTFLIVLYSML